MGDIMSVDFVLAGDRQEGPWWIGWVEEVPGRMQFAEARRGRASGKFIPSPWMRFGQQVLSEVNRTERTPADQPRSVFGSVRKLSLTAEAARTCSAVFADLGVRLRSRGTAGMSS